MFTISVCNIQVYIYLTLKYGQCINNVSLSFQHFYSVYGVLGHLRFLFIHMVLVMVLEVFQKIIIIVIHLILVLHTMLQGKLFSFQLRDLIFQRLSPSIIFFSRISSREHFMTVKRLLIFFMQTFSHKHFKTLNYQFLRPRYFFFCSFVFASNYIISIFFVRDSRRMREINDVNKCQETRSESL